ncbi:A24 family peptidase [uncultured Aquitalea sp.]|uniref:prepilin peptidase n=1 Tax=uncultured Aquitalea sp. TaxID=540272 RepID=UPI0025D3790C|nr:A24 family peptidase [uncultured Aquitalea sp.]
MSSVVEMLALSPLLLSVCVLVLGLLIGSFLNVVIYRLPLMMERQWRAECADLCDCQSSGEALPVFNLMTPPSRCPMCEAPVRAWQNIPLFSYLALGGKCGTCKARISFRYPMVELLTGVLFAVVACKVGWSATLPGYLFLTAALVALTFIDADTQLLPDSLTLPLLWAGLLFNLVTGAVPLADAVIGAMAGYLSLWSVYWIFKLATGKDGMGFGDFKLLAALGAWLGWSMLPLIILLSSLVGAVYGVLMILLARHGRGQPLPFGPYLAAAGWIALLWGPGIVAWYLHGF